MEDVLNEYFFLLDELIIGISEPSKMWGYTLALSDGHLTPIKDVSFCMLTNCMMETGEAKVERFKRLRQLATQTNRSNLMNSLKAFEELCDNSIDILSKLTEAEFVSVQLIRNRVSHGFLEGRRRSHRRIYTLYEGTIKKENVAKSHIERLTAPVRPLMSHCIQPARIRLQDDLSQHVLKIAALKRDLDDLGGIRKLLESNHMFFPDSDMR